MAESKGELRMLYARSSWMTAITLSTATGFSYDLRGATVENTAESILSTWRRNPRYEVTYLTAWDALAKFPETPDALSQYNVVILNDIDSDLLVLYPGDRLFRTPMGPNRLKSIREYVCRGGALLMVGGYFSFTGAAQRGKLSTHTRGGSPSGKMPASDDDRVEAPRA
jgi:uncharacterized membrane protein